LADNLSFLTQGIYMHIPSPSAAPPPPPPPIAALFIQENINAIDPREKFSLANKQDQYYKENPEEFTRKFREAMNVIDSLGRHNIRIYSEMCPKICETSSCTSNCELIHHLPVLAAFLEIEKAINAKQHSPKKVKIPTRQRAPSPTLSEDPFSRPSSPGKADEEEKTGEPTIEYRVKKSVRFLGPKED
jgi:hypothetical protein